MLNVTRRRKAKSTSTSIRTSIYGNISSDFCKNNFTISFYFKKGEHLFEKNYVGIEDLVSIFQNDNHGILIELNTASGEIRFLYRAILANMGGVDILAPFRAEEDVWYHVVAERDNGVNRLFVDGNLLGEAVATVGIQVQGDVEILLGRLLRGDSSRVFSGYFYSFQIWSASLNDICVTLDSTLEEMMSYFISTRGDEYLLVYYWPLDDGKGSVCQEVNGKQPLSCGGGWSVDSPTFESRVYYRLENPPMNFKEYLFSEDLSDVVFEIGDTEIPAHKTLLAMRSEYFKKLFSYDSSNKIVLADIGEGPFRTTLEFLYTNDCTLDGETVLEVMFLADEYVISDLVKKCEKYIIKYLNVDTAIEILTLSDEAPVISPRLKNYTKHYLSLHYETIVSLHPEHRELLDSISEFYQNNKR